MAQNSKIVSKTTHYRRIRRAKDLGVSVDNLPETRGKHNNHAKGSKHYRWNGRIISTEGYVKVRVGKNHPLADNLGYAYEHRVIYANKFGVASIEGKIVHHKNNDKQDNRLENLEVMTIAEHNKHHNENDRTRDDKGRFVAGRLLDGVEHNGMPGRVK